MGGVCEGFKAVETTPTAAEQNGKIERFHKTLKREFFYRYCSFTDSLETINYKYALWLPHYNYYRRHRGLGMKGLTPAQKLTITMFKGTVNTLIINPQKVTGTLQQYIVGADEEAGRVSDYGLRFIRPNKKTAQKHGGGQDN